MNLDTARCVAHTQAERIPRPKPRGATGGHAESARAYLEARWGTVLAAIQQLPPVLADAVRRAEGEM